MRSSLRIARQDSRSEFIAAAADLLARDPVGNTLLLSAIDAQPGKGANPWCGVVAFDSVGRAVACAVRERAAMFLSIGSATAAYAIGETLHSADWLHAIVGPESSARACARGLHRKVSLRFALKLLRLRAPAQLSAPVTGGLMRKADAADMPTLETWGEQFRREVGVAETPAAARSQLIERVGEGDVRVWQNDDGTALGYAVGRPIVPALARISTVYVVPTARGNGVAHALVSAFCAELIAAGINDVHLFADARNAIANRLYRRIGFRPYARYLHLAQTPPQLVARN